MNFLLNICDYFVSTMDRGQTMDVVDTPAIDWPALEDFQEPEETLKWCDVQPGTYKVLEKFNQGQGKFGPSVVLNLESANGSTFLVWAPCSLVFAMAKRKSTKFILNLGVKVSETGSVFYDFKLSHLEIVFIYILSRLSVSS